MTRLIALLLLSVGAARAEPPSADVTFLKWRDLQVAELYEEAELGLEWIRVLPPGAEDVASTCRFSLARPPRRFRREPGAGGVPEGRFRRLSGVCKGRSSNDGPPCAGGILPREFDTDPHAMMHNIAMWDWLVARAALQEDTLAMTRIHDEAVNRLSTRDKAAVATHERLAALADVLPVRAANKRLIEVPRQLRTEIESVATFEAWLADDSHMTLDLRTGLLGNLVWDFRSFGERETALETIEALWRIVSKVERGAGIAGDTRAATARTIKEEVGLYIFMSLSVSLAADPPWDRLTCQEYGGRDSCTFALTQL